MNFEYDKEQQEAIRAFRTLCDEEIAAADADFEGLSADAVGRSVKGLVAKIAQAGGPSWAFPAEVGGAGKPTVEAVAHWESIGRASASLLVALDASVSLCARAVYLYGSDDQKAAYLPDLLGGKAIGAFAATEWAAGSDLSMIETKAEESGGGWVVTGTKAMIACATLADVIVFLADTDRGRSLFVAKADTPGIAVGDPIPTLGLAGAPVAEITFAACKLPADALLGTVGGADEAIETVMTAARVTFAAGCIGVGMRILDESIAFANERKAFGKPIFKNQEFSFRIADMRLLTDGARVLTQYTAWLMDRGEGDVPSLAACAKLFAGESATWIANAGMSVFGGTGYLKQCVMERLYRDARYLEVGDGTSEVLRGRIGRKTMEPYQ